MAYIGNRPPQKSSSGLRYAGDDDDGARNQFVVNMVSNYGIRGIVSTRSTDFTLEQNQVRKGCFQIGPTGKPTLWACQPFGRPGHHRGIFTEHSKMYVIWKIK